MSFQFQDDQIVRAKDGKNTYRVQIRNTGAKGKRAFLACHDFVQIEEFTNGINTLQVEAKYHTISLGINETDGFEIVK